MRNLIEFVLIGKSPLSPLCQRGEFTSLWQREVWRDFIKKCCSVIAVAFLVFSAGPSAAFTAGDLFKYVDKVKKTTTTVEKASREITDQEEYYVGRAVAARILATYPLIENRQLTQYLNEMGQTLAVRSAKPVTYGGYHFAVLGTDEVNAFACPGGIIFVTKGMLAEVRNEDELAAVLAHEISHVNHRDGIASIKQSRWTEALTVLGKEAAEEYAPQDLMKLVGIFEESIDDVFKTLVVNGYGASQEHGADKSALTIVAKTGYSPLAMKEFLTRLAARGKGSKGGILTTHPAAPDRIRNVENNMPGDSSDPSAFTHRTTRFAARSK